MLEPLFDFFLLAAIDGAFTEALMYKYLRAMSTSWFLVAFRNGQWWRLCPEGKKNQPLWYQQHHQFSSKGVSLATSPSETTSTKRIPVNTLGLAATVGSVVRVHRLPFYGTTKIMNYNIDGTPAGLERGATNFTRTLRARVSARHPEVGLFEALESAGQLPASQVSETQEQNATPSAACENSVDTSDTLTQVLATVNWERDQEQEDDHRELQRINEELAATQETTQQLSTVIEGAPDTATVTGPSTQNNDSSQSQPTQQTATVSSQAEHNTSSVTETTSPVNGYALIMGTQSDEARASSRNAKLTRPFERPKGVVPRLLFGNRGKRLINLLKRGAQEEGANRVLVWLNAPKHFERKRHEPIQGREPTDEQIQERALRKFQYGNVGDAFRVLKAIPTERISPTPDQVEDLFPSVAPETPQPQFPPKADERISIPPGQLETVLRNLPRNKSCGPSQLSYDHVRYVCSHDPEMFRSFTETLEFLLNAPEKAPAACFQADAFFLRKPKSDKLRPIVLQECLTKILHRWLNRRLVERLAASKQLLDTQYCINHSNGTAEAARRVQLFMGKGDGEARYAIAIDYTNAFNSINRYAVMQNLAKSDVDKTILHYIGTYLERFDLNVDGRRVKNKRGVPQGCPLSMTLFAVGIMGLLQKMTDTGIEAVAYADDLVIMHSDRSKLEDAFEELKRDSEVLGLCINEAKTKRYTNMADNVSAPEYTSLHKVAWTYLGIPIACKTDLVLTAIGEFLDGVEKAAKTAWSAQLRHEAYFTYRYCVQSKVVHILRGTDLPVDRDTFNYLTKRQKRLDALMPTLVRNIPMAYRSLPVSRGGLGLTNLALAQRAARTALLTDIGEVEQTSEMEELMAQKRVLRKETAQARYAAVLSCLVFETQKNIAKPLNTPTTEGLNCTAPEDSLWLTAPPCNPSQVLDNDAFMIAIWLRYGHDGLVQRHQVCPCERKRDLTLEHAIGCKKFNTGIQNIRHHAVTKIIGTALAQKGATLYYERFPRGRGKPSGAPVLNQLDHRPDILIYKEEDEIALDVYVHSAYSTDSPNKDMHKMAAAIKDRQYADSKAKKNGIVHYVLWDTAGRAGPDVCKNLRRLGVGRAAMRAIQLAIFRSNAEAYRNVTQQIATRVNGAYLGMHDSHQQIIPQYYLEDAVAARL